MILKSELHECVEEYIFGFFEEQFFVSFSFSKNLVSISRKVNQQIFEEGSEII
jgi:hypothetical protein